MNRGERLRGIFVRVKKQLAAECNTIGTGWMYFTRVPLPEAIVKRINFSQSSLEQSAKYLPLAGIVVGAFGGAVFLGANELFESKSLAVLLSMLATIAFTGAIHEDGLADFFDAFAGGWWSKDRILEIMKDSRLGTFGALAAIISFLVKFQALILLPDNMIPSILIAAHAFSRYAGASFIFTHSYVRKNDDSYFKPMIKQQMTTKDFIVMTVIGMLPLALVNSLLFLLLIPILWLIRNLFGAWFIRKIGGYTGDCLGATQQIIEIACYLVIIVAYLHPLHIGG